MFLEQGRGKGTAGFLGELLHQPSIVTGKT